MRMRHQVVLCCGAHLHHKPESLFVPRLQPRLLARRRMPPLSSRSLRVAACDCCCCTRPTTWPCRCSPALIAGRRLLPRLQPLDRNVRRRGRVSWSHPGDTRFISRHRRTCCRSCGVSCVVIESASVKEDQNLALKGRK